MTRSVLAPLFGRLLMLQQRIGQAAEARQWGWLEELDHQLRACLVELAPHRDQLNPQQQQVLTQFASQYKQLWESIRQQSDELGQQLTDLRQQHEGTLAYDWVSQLGEPS